jgi:hypothetical protein
MDAKSNFPHSAPINHRPQSLVLLYNCWQLLFRRRDKEAKCDTANIPGVVSAVSISRVRIYIRDAHRCAFRLLSRRDAAGDND